MMKLYVDVQFSRRKRLHYILTEHDETTYTCAKIEDALHWLQDRGERQFWLIGEKHQFCVDLQVLKDMGKIETPAAP